MTMLQRWVQTTGRVAVAVRLFHTGGCSEPGCGCCGHELEALDAAGAPIRGEMTWEHPEPEENPCTWAEALAAAAWPGLPLAWERCDIQPATEAHFL